MRIYNHDIMTCTHEQVEGNHLYSGRVLGMTNPDDVIQLHPDLQSEWDAITAHYQRVGLRPSLNAVWDISLERMADYPEHQPSVFYFGDTVHPHSPKDQIFQQLDKSWHHVVQFMNCKNNFMQLARDLNVAVPQTFCFDTVGQVHSTLPYPCYLKPSVSVDGVGIVRCETPEHLQDALKTLPSPTSFQIQAEVIASTFLNLQYQIVGNEAHRLAATEQILDGCAHGGNRYPTQHQPWDLVEPMAQWMAGQGMQDVLAFDVAVVADQEQPTYLAIECNPRFNGASYPTGVARKLEIPCWSCETFHTSHRTLCDLELTGLEYDPATGSGVILVNWGPILVGKLVILLAGTAEEQQQLRQALQAKLG